MAADNITLTHDTHAGTFVLLTIDTHGHEHAEIFTVPAGAPVFNVHGMDCVLLRELLAGGA